MPLKAKGRKPDPKADLRADLGEAPRADARREKSFRRDDAYEEGVDEPLFEPPSKSAKFRIDAEAEDDRGRKAREEQTAKKAEARQRPEEEEPDPRKFRAGRRDDEEQKTSARSEREHWREAEEAREQDLRAVRDRKEAKVVDADFEDLGRPSADFQDQTLGRGFGRKMRDRETALARLEDLEPIAERVFNEEFFTALRVQPKELERAIRKARRRAEAREKNRLTPWRALGWSAWIGVIAACSFVAYSYRNNIVAMFPNAKGAYDAVGIEANPYGLKIEGVTHRVAMSPEGPVIEILGRLRNGERGDVAPPMLQAEALGADGEVLSRWTFAARAEKVRAGESADFSTRAPAPDGVSEVVLAFVPAEGVKVSVGGLLKTPEN